MIENPCSEASRETLQNRKWVIQVIMHLPVQAQKEELIARLLHNQMQLSEDPTNMQERLHTTIKKALPELNHKKIQLIAEIYTPELEAFIQFYSSPIGKSVLLKLSLLIEEANLMGMNVISSLAEIELSKNHSA